MADERQPFRFRLPWLAAPQPAPAAPHPSQTTQTQTQPAPASSRPSQGSQAPSRAAPFAPRPSQTAQAPSSQAAPAAPRSSDATQTSSKPADSLTQRAPFRPAGVVQRPPTQPTPSSSPKGTSQPASGPRETRSSKGPPASPSRNVSQILVTSQPASPSQPSSKIRQATKAPPQSPSPSHGDIKETRTTATATPSQANLPSPTKKPINIKTEISQIPEESRRRESSKPPSKDPKQMLTTTPSPQEVVDSLQEPKKQPAFEESKVKGSTRLRPQLSSPRQEPRPQPAREVYTISYTAPKQITKGKHDDQKKEADIDKEVKGSKTQTRAHRLADEQGKHSEEEVYDVKEVFKNIENTGRDTEREIYGQERVPRFPQKQAGAGGQKASFHKEIKENLPKFAHKQGAQQGKHLLYEKPLSIITLTGENIGATMHLGSEFPNKKTPIHIHRGYKINPDESAEITTDGEGSSRKRKSGDMKLQEDLATKTFVNNNVQGLNNSLVFNSTVKDRDPGVHVVHYLKPIEPVKPIIEKDMLDTHKIEVSRTPADMLAYAPTIRRRCLRGLMMESSDSDPEKPRSHGCRVGCTQRSKDGTIDLL